MAKKTSKAMKKGIKALDDASKSKDKKALQLIGKLSKVPHEQKLTADPNKRTAHEFDLDDLAKEIKNETYTDKGPKVSLNDLVAVLNNPVKATQAELLSGHDLSDVSNNIKLGWDIARHASETFGGRPIEYIRGGAIKQAAGLIQQVNELKPTIANIGSASSIIDGIMNEYERTIIEQASSGEISRGAIYQVDRLRQQLKNYQINGTNASQTGFWQFLIDFGGIRVTYQGFYDSGDGLGSVNSVDAGPLLQGTQDVLRQVDALVPAYLQASNR